MGRGNSDVFVLKSEIPETGARGVIFCERCKSPVVDAPGAMARHDIRVGHVKVQPTVDVTVTIWKREWRQ